MIDFRLHPNIDEIDARAWDALWPNAYPFTQHRFLQALEHSGCTGEASGWVPMHLAGYREGSLVVAAPVYLKQHSYGEYVFDWSWADAYHRNGLNYYPKLVNAIPYTPATGPRIAGDHEDQLRAWAFLKSQVEVLNCSSLHCLFPSQDCDRAIQQDAETCWRRDCQFHWFNRGYADFDAFLAEFSSRKRKNVRKERQKVAALDYRWRNAADVNAEDWQDFYQLYHRTYLKRSGRAGYLKPGFFPALAQALPEQCLLLDVRHQGELLAAALYFRDAQTLYGRYWGCAVEIDGLHFETCYYRGIEYAIAEGLQRFDPGAQGEHKIQRGFQAVLTQSAHYLPHPGFREAVAHFCDQELQHTHAYVGEARAALPFREDVPQVDAHCLASAAPDHG